MDAVYTVAWHAYDLATRRRGWTLLIMLILMSMLMGACHKTYDDWMNN